MGRSFRGKDREEFRKRKSTKATTKASSKPSIKRSGVEKSGMEEEVSSLLASTKITTRSTPPPTQARAVSMEADNIQPAKPAPIYKDLAGTGHLTAHAKRMGLEVNPGNDNQMGSEQLVQARPISSQPLPPSQARSVGSELVGRLEPTRYKQPRDPLLNTLPPELMQIIHGRPLRGEVKFFDQRGEKLFGFIAVDPVDKTVAELAVMGPKELLALRRKEVFFHYFDVSQPIVQSITDTYPTLVERRDIGDFNPPYPQQRDRVVFYPISVPNPPGMAGERAKAVPWAYEKEWEAAMEDCLK